MADCVICPTCGAEFEPRSYQQAYCTTRCQIRGASRRAKHRARARLAEQRADHPLNCEECGTPFVAHWGSQKFCSRECSLKPQARKLQKAQYNTGYGRRVRTQTPWRALLWYAKDRARRAGLSFDLTEEWAINRWTGRCEMSDLPFQVGLEGHQRVIWAPSIDRIEPEKGYTQDNCRFVLFAINSFKHAASDDDIYLIAEAPINNRPASTQEAAE